MSCRLPALPFLLLLALAGCAQHSLPITSEAPDHLAIQAPRHGDFKHYTLALTWQPGFCLLHGQNTCKSDQPQTPLIGLHGLWASRPSDLIKNHQDVTIWWKKGCSIYADAAPMPTVPALSSGLSTRLSSVVAHLPSDLVAHEYAKHASCFGMNAEQFFTVAATLRDRFAALPASTQITAKAGQVISKSELQTLIQTDTGPLPEKGLQFQCNKDSTGRMVLAQLWFTLKPEKLGEFPHASSFISSPWEQDNCPTHFLLPNWDTIKGTASSIPTKAAL